MSDRGWGTYCEEAGHEKGTNQKKNIYIYIDEVALVKHYRRRCGKGERAKVEENVGVAGVGW